MRGGRIVVAPRCGGSSSMVEQAARESTGDDADLRRQVVAELLIALANGRSGSSHGGGSIQ
ncbi:hypothetical protein BSL82_05820 [Tardibacter chloracetimidivorans]|uniref:Uncharacterized protein n=1 Tax=Tardibacter chloracetimidivorans TaxID=1921510 RepID=A0A1L3ZTD6_9SPHN|nr:hypothetical protein [Tardibacter chloracetimidivorans]API58887.1 hypothetical protein BSL82_05820 [Tardibacter chloracetimidivorans]